MNNPFVYELSAVTKQFIGPNETIDVLKNVNLNIHAGSSLAILGASGSGKSTLLHLLGGLDVPTSGSVLFGGRDLARLGPRKIAAVRNREIGFVFQFHHLLPEFTARENVAMPALIAGEHREVALESATTALGLVGLGHRLDHKVTTLSGGERQRAAIARAVLLHPRVLLADEPTGNLDEKTGEAAGELLAGLNEDLGTTLVVVTHNLQLAHRMGKQLELHGGELYGQA
ncbi:ABC transporter ATP-binding protein [Desulfovibrio inopinatus]|uniref:ABC transporter ATP-binding protein n=1 Tax=Desulfovibrio inopinatus TaxID=102109 RepID=UPI00041DC917|nr:ABC transporter ATP-binding protein [Desulfovibrio inopinatus]